MARVFITGSTDGLGLGAAKELLSQGHEVVLHARTKQRAATLSNLRCPVIVGDLSSGAETRSLAAQVNALGRMNAVIHNAGTYREPVRGKTPEGHARTFAVNTLAPYLLSALIERPDRLIYVSSGLHRSGTPSLRDLDWRSRPWDASQAYSDSKLHVTALALAIARRWPKVLSHAVDPGWVPTKMGGAGAPDDLELGHRTQAWLAVSDDKAAKRSGGYWHHQTLQPPAADARDADFQDELVRALGELTGTTLPA